MQRIRRGRRWVSRANGKVTSGIFATVCIGACAFILLTSAAAVIAGRVLNRQNEHDDKRPALILERAQIDADVDEVFLMELIGSSEPESTGNIALFSDAPSVLIYHTHTTEGFFPSEEHDYAPASGWRNPDEGMNIVAVGDELARILTQRYGINVIHDTTDHEPPKLSTAYSRSLETMLSYKERYPDIALFIDLHRDSYGEPTEPSDYLVIDGEETARIMFVVGTGKGATGTGFDEMPDFTSNYALARRLTEHLQAIDPELARKIRVKAGRYNQHVSGMCLLAEIGHNANTLEQALNAAGYLADAIASAAGLDAVSSGEQTTVLPLTP